MGENKKNKGKMMDLNKIKIGHSPLTDTIFLYRHGKDPALALDKREAEADVIIALISHMMHDAPKGSEKTVELGAEKYLIRVTPKGKVKMAEDKGGLHMTKKEKMDKEQIKKLADTLLSTYLIIAHDGHGLKGEHYFVQEDELTGLIQSEITLQEILQ